MKATMTENQFAVCLHHHIRCTLQIYNGMDMRSSLNITTVFTDYPSSTAPAHPSYTRKAMGCQLAWQKANY